MAAVEPFAGRHQLPDHPATGSRPSRPRATTGRARHRNPRAGGAGGGGRSRPAVLREETVDGAVVYDIVRRPPTRVA